MGLSIGSRQGYGGGCYPLRKVVVNWTKRNYLWLREKNPDIADACLVGSISFDKNNRRLVKTYMKGLRREVPREYLDLDLPNNALDRSSDL